MAASKKSAQSKPRPKAKRSTAPSAAKRAAEAYERRIELQVMVFAILSIIFLIAAIVRYS
jgi:hypothetical protein